MSCHMANYTGFFCLYVAYAVRPGNDAKELLSMTPAPIFLGGCGSSVLRKGGGAIHGQGMMREGDTPLRRKEWSQSLAVEEET